MKIYCTQLEKKELLWALGTMRRCFIDGPCPPTITSCTDCIEQNIEWVITGTEEENTNEGS